MLFSTRLTAWSWNKNMALLPNLNKGSQVSLKVSLSRTFMLTHGSVVSSTQVILSENFNVKTMVLAIYTVVYYHFYVKVSFVTCSGSNYSFKGSHSSCWEKALIIMSNKGFCHRRSRLTLERSARKYVTDCLVERNKTRRHGTEHWNFPHTANATQVCSHWEMYVKKQRRTGGSSPLMNAMWRGRRGSRVTTLWTWENLTGHI